MSHRLVTNTVQAPAAGADFKFTISDSDRALILAVKATLTTSVTAGNRRPGMMLADQNNLAYWCSDVVWPQAASLAVTYSWARGASLLPAAATVTGQKVAAPLPWLRLAPNDQFESATLGIAGTDQWSSIVYRAIVGDWWEDEQELMALAHALMHASG